MHAQCVVLTHACFVILTRGNDPFCYESKQLKLTVTVLWVWLNPEGVILAAGRLTSVKLAGKNQFSAIELPAEGRSTTH